MMAPWQGFELAQAGASGASGASPAPAAGQSYFRSDSSDSAARMLQPSAAEAPPRSAAAGRKRCSRLWLAVGAVALLALQIASTTGLFVYFTLSVGKLKAQAQGTSEELRCLLLLNRLQDISNYEELVSNQSCQKLAVGIMDYVASVMEDVSHKSAQQAAEALEKLDDTSSSSWEGQLASGQPGSKASGHLTLGRQTLDRPGNPRLFGELQQSCLHPISQWANETMHTHLQNMAYQDGKLHITQPGKYYVYAQVYFRYPTEAAGPRSLVHQLVQCVNLQSTYGHNSLLLKGVGTKCWAKDAIYGLHALCQGGVFDLKAGDRLFISVSSLDLSYNDEAGSYFGAFRLPG